LIYSVARDRTEQFAGKIIILKGTDVYENQLYVFD